MRDFLHRARTYLFFVFAGVSLALVAWAYAQDALTDEDAAIADEEALIDALTEEDEVVFEDKDVDPPPVADEPATIPVDQPTDGIEFLEAADPADNANPMPEPGKGAGVDAGDDFLFDDLADDAAAEPADALPDEAPGAVDDLPAAIDELPAEIEDLPEPLAAAPPEVIEEPPAEIEELPPEVAEEVPVEIEELPEVVEELPAEIEELPEVVEELPAEIEDLPEPLAEVPEVAEEPPEVIEELPVEIEEPPPEVAEEVPAEIEEIPDEILDLERRMEGTDRQISRIEGGGLNDEPVEMPLETVEPPEAVEEFPPVAPADGIPDELRVLVLQERVRISAKISGMKHLLDLGEKALKGKDCVEARVLFGAALSVLDELFTKEHFRPQRQRAKTGLCEAHLLCARAYLEARQIPQAEEALRLAVAQCPTLKPGVVRKLQADIDAEKLKQLAGVEDATRAPANRVEEASFQDKQREILDNLQRGRQHFLLGEYDEARKSFDAVLAKDPYHEEAHALRTKVHQRTYELRQLELKGTEREMIQEVAKAWRPKDYVPRVPTAFDLGSSGGGDIPKPSRVIAKMKEIKIPQISFRNANVIDVINFLSDASRRHAPPGWSEEERLRGINMILKLDDGGGAQVGAAPAEEDIFGGIGVDPTESIASGGPARKINLNLRYATMYEALKQIVLVADLKFRIEDDIVIIVDKDAADGEIISQTYSVMPNFLERLTTLQQETGQGRRGGGGGQFIGFQEDTEYQTAEPKQIFADLGVPFPDGSTLKYVPSLGKIFVANTAENMLKFENVLKEINVVPNQIEIEARFVDIGQSDLSEIGLEWLLTDDWEIATKKTPAGTPPSGRERVSMPANDGVGGFTRGLRYLGDVGGVPEAVGGGAGVIGSFLTLQTMLTNPELRFVLHALEQSGNANLLSAPKVLAQNSEEAEIKVVREFIYPTEFDTEPIQVIAEGGGTVQAGTTVTPTSFETREVGVLLNVIPEVGPGGKLITLTLTPQVVSGPDFIDYGSSITLPDGTVNTTSFRQPIFFVRTVTTKVMLYDGSTVVMGGMITEELTTSEDKVPLLGDIPLLGRMFRSKTKSSQKRNLLIFVTARLVSPAGEPLNEVDESSRASVFSPQE